MEVSVAEMGRAAAGVPADVRRAIVLAARNIRKVANRQVPQTWQVATSAGVTIEQRVIPLDRVGCYVPGGRYPLPSSLLMTAVTARAAGVNDVVAVCPRPDPTVMLAALEAGVSRLFRLGGAHAIAALAYGTNTVPRVDKIVGPGNAYVAAAKALVARDCAIDFLAGPSEIIIVSASGRADWIAADLIAQAEHDPDARAILLTPSRRLAAAVAKECARQLPRDGPAAAALKKRGGIVVTRSIAEAIGISERIAPEHVVCDDDSVARRLTRAGTVFVGAESAQALGDYMTGSNHVLPTGGAARARGGLSAADFVRVTSVQRVSARGLKTIGPPAAVLARAEGLIAHARSIEMRLGEVGTVMTYQYERVLTPSVGLRLHLNENTAGCSPAVIDALHAITCEQAAFYPDYSRALTTCAAYLGVDERQLALTNGLDEGILAASVAALRGSSETTPFEAIVIVPAFDMYAACADAAGGRVVEVASGDDFAFPLEQLLGAINSRTRIVFLTNPNNPTGLSVPREAILTVADAAPHATIFLDEAYADFSRTTLIGDPALPTRPNVLIGRTFAKAHGLAALRAGALVGAEHTISRIRKVIPPYSLNLAAAVALPAALEDTRHHRDYLRQVARVQGASLRNVRPAGHQVLAKRGELHPGGLRQSRT